MDDDCIIRVVLSMREFSIIMFSDRPPIFKKIHLVIFISHLTLMHYCKFVSPECTFEHNLINEMYFFSKVGGYSLRKEFFHDRRTAFKSGHGWKYSRKWCSSAKKSCRLGSSSKSRMWCGHLAPTRRRLNLKTLQSYLYGGYNREIPSDQNQKRESLIQLI